MRKKLLLIGGSGAIGSEILRSGFIKKYDAINYDLVASPYCSSNIVDTINNISNYIESVASVDYIIYLMSASLPRDGILNVGNDLNINLLGLLNTLSLLEKSKCKKLVFLSSAGSVYGNNDILLTEESVCNPISSYGITKLAQEQYIKLYCNEFNINYVVLRVSNPYGMKFNAKLGIHGIVPTLFNNLINKTATTIFGNGEACKDYIYIDQLTDVIRYSLSDDVRGVYNVGSGLSCTINQLVKHIENITKLKPSLIYKSNVTTDVSNFRLSVDKMKHDFPFVKIQDINSGLDMAWSKFKNE